jgi:hypothetical protein
MSVERCANGSARCRACDCRWFPYTASCHHCAEAGARDIHAAKPASRFTRDQVEALTARANRLKPIPAVSTVESSEWVDSSRVHAWGAPPKRSPLLRTWARGNCLKACVSSLLAADVSRVPDPTRDFAHEGWFERYDKRLQEATGHRLEPLPAHACPPRRPTQLWIAIIAEDGPSNHAVVARQAFVVHDPAGDYMGILPMDRLAGGLLVVPTRRVIPVFSPHRSGYSVVAA